MTVTVSPEDKEPESESLLDRIARLISEKKDMVAVRRLRDRTQLGLSECTRVINALKKKL